MKKVYKLLSVLLCAVMIIGIAPVMLPSGNAVTAADEDKGVVQGANDAVVMYNGGSFRGFLGLLVGGKVNGIGKDGTSNGARFDRIIVVLAVSKDLGTGAFAFAPNGSKVFDNKENIVFTHKCTVTNDNAWTVNSELGVSKYGQKNVLINYYDSESDDDYRRLVFAKVDTCVHYLRCAVTFDYLNVHFGNTNPLIYCQGFDFTVTENVKFTYGGTAVSYKPIVINGNGSSAASSAASTQTITLNGGEYQYISPRSRGRGIDVENKTINIFLGNVHFVGGPATQMARNAVMADDNYVGTTINVEVDGAIFDNAFWLLGATEFNAASAPTVEDSTINLHIKSGTFRKGIKSTVVPSNASYKQYDTTGGLKINITVDSIILNDNIIEVEHSDDADNITSAFYYSPCFESELMWEVEGVDSIWALSEEDCVRTTCGLGASKLVYKNVFDEDQKVEVQRNCGHNYAPYTDLDTWAPHHKCTYCLADDESFALLNDQPVLYVTGTAGDQFNSGLTEQDGVDTIERASELLSGWDCGGTIVNCSTFLKVQDGEVWQNVGGWINLTSKDETCKVQFLGTVNFESHVEFYGLHLAGTGSPKTLFLNYNSFIVHSDCTQEAPLSPGYKLAVVSGARAASSASIEKHATGAHYIDQHIELNALNWDAVMAGTKQASVESEYYASNTDKSVDCAGIVKIYVSGDAKVNNVDLVTLPEIHASVIFDEDKSFNINNNHDSSKIIFDGGVNNVIEVYGNFTETEGDVDGSEEHVYIHAPEAFEQKGLSLREKTADGIIGIRATYGIDRDVDENSVVEFGTLVVSDFYYSNTRYFRGSTYYGGNSTVDALHNGAYVAKSVAYLMNSQGKAAIANYELGANDTKATFRATVEFSDDDIMDYEGVGVNFTPYAVVKNNAGWYTVIGDVDGSAPFVLANDILSDDEASVADKEKAAAVIEYLDALDN